MTGSSFTYKRLQGQHSNVGTVFFAVGFSVMMVLDVALGWRLGVSESEIIFGISENAYTSWQRRWQGVLFWQKDRWEAAFYRTES